MDLAHAIVATPAAPTVGGGTCIGQQMGTVDQQHRQAIDLQRAPVAQIWRDVGDEGQIVFGAVLLADQDVIVAPVPAPRPVLVGPAQAERQVDAVVVQPLAQRVFHQRAAAEPVVVEAERADAILRSQTRLVTHHLRIAQVVEAEVGRQAWLHVAFELRQGTGDIAPFCKALAPPGIVLRERVELRQVERHQGSGQWRGQDAFAPGDVADRWLVGAPPQLGTGARSAGVLLSFRRRRHPVAMTGQPARAQTVALPLRQRQCPESRTQQREQGLTQAAVGHGAHSGSRERKRGVM
ncbi:hypothetical protein D3C71_1279620 [compost metagenome]